MGHPRSHSWCGTESAAGEGSLRCVISSVARNFSERFLGPTNTVGPRNDKESAIGGRALRPPTLARRGWGTPGPVHTSCVAGSCSLCLRISVAHPMRIKIIGDNDCARALRGLLRKAGFAVSEYLAPELVKDLPGGGYVVYIDPAPGAGPGVGTIHFDSVDCELEANILRHVTALWKSPVGLNRPGGRVHSDQEIRILVPLGNEAAALAVEFGVLRGLTDTVHGPSRSGGSGTGRLSHPWRTWYRKLFGGKA